MLTLDLYTALDLSARLVSVGVAVSGLELLSIRHDFGPQGVFSVGTVSLFHYRHAALHTVDRFLGIILGVQVLAAGMLAAIGPFTLVGRLMLILALGSTLMVRWRRHIGGDGAEQMGLLILIAVGLAVVPFPSVERAAVAVTFIAAQVGLSYVTAGLAKLVSPLWRNGSALPAILSTTGHGHPWASSVLKQHGGLALLATWGVMTFECTFPLLLFSPSWVVLLILTSGLVFHFSCAVLMGLNSFLWSFPGAYPCVVAAVTYWRL